MSWIFLNSRRFSEAISDFLFVYVRISQLFLYSNKYLPSALERTHLLYEIAPDLFVSNFMLSFDCWLNFHNFSCYRSLLVELPVFILAQLIGMALPETYMRS